MPEQEAKELEEKLDEMEEKIRQHQPVRFRKLRRSYNGQEAAPHKLVLHELMRRGRARYRLPRLIETIPAEEQAK
jgi:hypothetical protein